MIREIKFDPARRKFFRAAIGLASTIALAPLLPPWFTAHAAATIFVSAVDGSNADNGTTWALAKQSVAGAIAIAADGDIIVVDNAGTFAPTAAISWTAGAGAGYAIISATRSGTVSYTPAPGATESVGASSNFFVVTPEATKGLYIYGMTMNGGSNNNASCCILTNNSNFSYIYYDTCTFGLKSVNASTYVGIGPQNVAASRQVFKDCTFTCTASHTAQFFNLMGAANAEFINPTISFTGGTKPLKLFVGDSIVGVAFEGGNVIVRDGDLSGYNVASGTLVDQATLNGSITFKNLILSATPTIVSGVAGNSSQVFVRNCDSGNTDYVFQYYSTFGALTADTTVYKNGGASFNSEPVSWKIVTTAACSEQLPFVTPLLQIWDTSTAGQSPTISIAQASGATNLTDRNCWMDLDAAASATTTKYTYFTGRNAAPFTGSAVDWAADSGATWTGLSTPNKQLLSCGTVTPARAGLLQGRMIVAKASTTVYIDAKITGIS